MCNAIARAPRSSATLGTTRTCSCRRCTSHSCTRTTASSIAAVPGVSRASQIFDTASRDLRWHYQTAVLNEFLPSLVGKALVEDLLRDGPRFYRPVGQAHIPLEFADAAYRYGHSQIRHAYTLNTTSRPMPIFPDSDRIPSGHAGALG